jgi:hypothetical protein
VLSIRSSHLDVLLCVVSLTALSGRVLAQDIAPASVPTVLTTRDPAAVSKFPRRVVRPVSQPATQPQPPTQTASSTTVVASDVLPNVKVKGLTGTLNKGDIHQTMEARQAEFDACIDASRRRVRWVSGAIRFAFRVDGEGHIMDVHPTQSSIGHRELEQCLTAAVAATQFPKPAGRATAEFAWGMSVESANARPLEAASAKTMASLVRKQSRELFKVCEIRRRRARFQITAYIAPGNRLLSAGVVPLPARAEEKADCVLEQFAKWHMPKLKHASKVSFELR